MPATTSTGPSTRSHSGTATSSQPRLPQALVATRASTVTAKSGRSGWKSTAGNGVSPSGWNAP